MENLAIILRITHILFGSIGLIAYWVPVFTRKGSRQHKQFGKVFLYSAYVMLTAAALSLIIRYAQLISEGRGPEQEPYWYGLLFLLSQLVVLVFVTIRHGIVVLKQKSSPTKLNTPLNRGLAYLVILVSILVVAFALIYSPYIMIVLISLGLVGVFSGYDILKYIGGRKSGRLAWRREHLEAMLSAGIAYHTAFAVFGMTRIIDLSSAGWLGLVPWLLPTLIGMPAIILWNRYNRLQESPSLK